MAQPNYLPQRLPRPLVGTSPPPLQYTEARLHTWLAVAVKQGLQPNQYSPGIAASVMARPGTLCIATVNVLVVLAGVQPGEPYLTAKISACTCTMVLCQGKKCLRTK